MKRKKHKVNHRQRQRSNQSIAPAQASAPAVTGIRQERFRQFAVVFAVIGAVGWYLVGEVNAAICEGDLSRIGNGVPAVVQIHDPQCPHCVALQKEARDAVSNFDEDELLFLVANIRHSEGRRLANAHRVGHVTLLLFDGDGKRRRILAGPNKSEYLTREFRSHLKSLRPK